MKTENWKTLAQKAKPMLNDEQIINLTEKAVRAALGVIDKEIPEARRSTGPLGDSLAYKLHGIIESAIIKAV